MPVQLKIEITKEILERSTECDTRSPIEKIGNNCAIALALKDIFPDVFVTPHYIFPFGITEENKNVQQGIPLPKIARDFIKVFDSLRSIHKARLSLPEFEFDILIPDEIISLINIDEVKNFLAIKSFFSQKADQNVWQAF